MDSNHEGPKGKNLSVLIDDFKKITHTSRVKVPHS